jgi:metal-responsive CopG/Arc/MetJ family transcriptional regulator
MRTYLHIFHCIAFKASTTTISMQANFSHTKTTSQLATFDKSNRTNRSSYNILDNYSKHIKTSHKNHITRSFILETGILKGEKYKCTSKSQTKFKHNLLKYDSHEV